MKVMAALNAKGSLAAGIIAAIGASVCCVGPLLLLALGIGGAWIGNLAALHASIRAVRGTSIPIWDPTRR